jgi:hypothetical protein
MNKQLASTFAALAVLSIVADHTASPARAAVIYDNGAVTNAALTSDTGGFIRADDFILAPGASTITGVNWTGIYGSAIPHVDDDFTIQFFNTQSAGTLEEPQDANLAIATIFVANPNRTESGGIFSYSAAVSSLALLPNTRYWLSIFNDSSDEQTGWLWRGQTTTNNADVAALRNQSNSWGNETGRILDFQLIGEVPEPASIILILMGILAKFARRK